MAISEKKKRQKQTRGNISFWRNLKTVPVDKGGMAVAPLQKKELGTGEKTRSTRISVDRTKPETERTQSESPRGGDSFRQAKPEGENGVYGAATSVEIREKAGNSKQSAGRAKGLETERKKEGGTTSHGFCLVPGRWVG